MWAECWHHSLPGRQLTHHLLSPRQQEKSRYIPSSLSSAQAQGAPRQGCSQEQAILPSCPLLQVPFWTGPGGRAQFFFWKQLLFSKLLLPRQPFLYLWCTLTWETQEHRAVSWHPNRLHSWEMAPQEGSAGRNRTAMGCSTSPLEKQVTKWITPPQISEHDVEIKIAHYQQWVYNTSGFTTLASHRRQPSIFRVEINHNCSTTPL